MTHPLTDKIRAAAEDASVTCWCAGPMCSGCEEKTKKLFTRAANFGIQLALELEEVVAPRNVVAKLVRLEEIDAEYAEDVTAFDQLLSSLRGEDEA